MLQKGILIDKKLMGRFSVSYCSCWKGILLNDVYSQLH